MATVSIFISIISVLLLFAFFTFYGVLLIPFFILFVVLLSACFFASIFESPKHGLTVVSLILSGIMLLIYILCAFVFSIRFVTLLAPASQRYSYIVAVIIVLIILLCNYVRAKKHKLLIQRIPRDEQRAANTSSLSAPEELAKWKQLYDEGTITEEMFVKKRDELLRR